MVYSGRPRGPFHDERRSGQCPTLFPVRGTLTEERPGGSPRRTRTTGGHATVAGSDTQVRVLALADEAAAEVGVEVLQARVRQGSHGRASVVVTVDREGGVDLDAITAMSRALSDRLDRDDPVSGSYVLEVESPGERRPLRLPKDAGRFRGERVEVVFSDAGDLRRVSGSLLGADDRCVEIRREGADDADILPLSAVASARLAKPAVNEDPRKPGAKRRGPKGRHA